jgi:hypothetical protein
MPRIAAVPAKSSRRPGRPFHCSVSAAPGRLGAQSSAGGADCRSSTVQDHPVELEPEAPLISAHSREPISASAISRNISFVIPP